MEEKKSTSEEERLKLEAVLASIGEGIITTDEYAKIATINAQALSMLGFTKEELLGKWILEAFTVTDENNEPIPPDKRSITEALLTGKVIASTVNYIRHDGSRFLAGEIISPILVGDNPTGAVIVFRDVTREKEVDRMKTEFISIASHQLRTPLSAMRWFSEMLLAGDAGVLAAEQKEMVQNISDSNDRMIALVNSLLNISRIESGRLIVDPTPSDIVSVAKAAVTDVKAKADEKKQTIIVSAHENLPKINIDPKLIHHVYMNLLTNSIKYSPESSEITVFISLKDNEIISQISDNGYGIPETEQKKMFQKFFRATNIVERETDGTGLGMYLVKAIIDSSGGRVWFKSKEGEGTTVWFSLQMSGMKAKQGEVRIDQ